MSAIDTLLAALAAGRGVPADLFTSDAVLDATVPGWRFRRCGAAPVADQFSRWFTGPARFEELERRATPGGQAVTYLVTWEVGGVPHAAHHCHLLDLAPDGRIAADRFWCGGRWDAALLAEMGAAAHAS